MAWYVYKKEETLTETLSGTSWNRVRHARPDFTGRVLALQDLVERLLTGHFA